MGISQTLTHLYSADPDIPHRPPCASRCLFEARALREGSRIAQGHDFGRGTPLAQELRHDPHRLVDMLEKRSIAVAQHLEAGLPVPGAGEAILGHPPLQSEAGWPNQTPSATSNSCTKTSPTSRRTHSSKTAIRNSPPRLPADRLGCQEAVRPYALHDEVRWRSVMFAQSLGTLPVDH